MPPPQIFSLDGHAYGLTVSGVQVVDDVPTDVAPIRWDWPSATNNGGVTFTVEHDGEYAFPAGAVIRLTDNENDELLFAGVLTNVRTRRGVGPTHRYTDVTGTGWGFYLDNRQLLEDFAIEASPDTRTKAFHRLILAHGGPLQTSDAVIGDTAGGNNAAATAAAGSSLRSVISSLEIPTAEPPPRWYADNEAQVHWWTDAADEATAVGTATSIGDEGSLQPEFVIREDGYENVATLTLPINADGDDYMPPHRGAYPYGGADLQTGVTAWEAGDPTWAYQSPVYDVGLSLWLGSVYQMRNLKGPITAITFTTIEDGSWLPHQEITVDDSVLTGSVAETFYVAEVSGTIDDRNVVEKSVSIGARARSLVQTVASS